MRDGFGDHWRAHNGTHNHNLSKFSDNLVAFLLKTGRNGYINRASDT